MRSDENKTRGKKALLCHAEVTVTSIQEVEIRFEGNVVSYSQQGGTQKIKFKDRERRRKRESVSEREKRGERMRELERKSEIEVCSCGEATSDLWCDNTILDSCSDNFYIKS